MTETGRESAILAAQTRFNLYDLAKENWPECKGDTVALSQKPGEEVAREWDIPGQGLQAGRLHERGASGFQEQVGLRKQNNSRKMGRNRHRER